MVSRKLSASACPCPERPTPCGPASTTIACANGSLNPAAEIFQHRFSPILVLTTGRASKARLRQLRALADEVKVCGRQEINFRAAFCWLGGEGGAEDPSC